MFLTTSCPTLNRATRPLPSSVKRASEGLSVELKRLSLFSALRNSPLEGGREGVSEGGREGGREGEKEGVGEGGREEEKEGRNQGREE